MGRRLHMSRCQKRNKPNRALVLDPVSPMDNRGCFHAASVLTTLLIGSFGAEFEPQDCEGLPTVFKDLEGASPQKSPQCP
jgi:hypothetical protein